MSKTEKELKKALELEGYSDLDIVSDDNESISLFFFLGARELAELLEFAIRELDHLENEISQSLSHRPS